MIPTYYIEWSRNKTQDSSGLQTKHIMDSIAQLYYSMSSTHEPETSCTPLPEHDLRASVRSRRLLEINWFGVNTLLFHLDIVVEHEMSQQHLDFRDSEEATRTEK
jgi:hypothetical protein